MPGFTPAQRETFLAQLLRRRAAGETFAAIAATPGWPSRPTLRKWLRRRPDLDVPPLRARPTHWSQAVADEICERFHVESLRQICEDPAMPDRKSVYAWARARPDFAFRLLMVRLEARQPRTGRRSTYCDLIADDVVDAIFEAGSIAAACRSPDHPPARTVRDWAQAHPEFRRQIEIAYQMAHDRTLDARWAIADARLERRIAWHERRLARRRGPKVPPP